MKMYFLVQMGKFPACYVSWHRRGKQCHEIQIQVLKKNTESQVTTTQHMMLLKRSNLVPLPETNSKFAPENGWLENDPERFPILGLFSGANLLFVSGRVSGETQPAVHPIRWVGFFSS